MTVQGLNNPFLGINKISINILLLILFSILIIFMGASISILLFTYTNTIKLVESNQNEILINKELNHEIINNTREIPLQNRMMLEDLTTVVNFLGANFNQSFINGIYEERRMMNITLQEIRANQRILAEHVNATTDILGTASHTSSPDLRNALYSIAASNPTMTRDSFTTQLDSLLSDLNQSTTIIQNLQEQVKNLSSQVPNDTEQTQQAESIFPFAQNRIERADIPENESLLKEPENGTLASIGKPQVID